MFYGARSVEKIKELALDVCNCLGRGPHGSRTDFLLEMAAVETGLGTREGFRPNDHQRELIRKKGHVFEPRYGLYQMRESDIVKIAHSLNRRQSDPTPYQLIYKTFGIDIYIVKPADLDTDAMLATVYMAIETLYIPEHIPLDLHGRGNYWFQYFNDGRFASYRQYTQASNMLLRDKR